MLYTIRTGPHLVILSLECLIERCGHCRAMAEAWEQLAADWEGHDIGLVGEVDCTTDEGLPLCEDFEVQVCLQVVVLFYAVWIDWN